MSTPIEVLKKYWGYSSFRPLQDEIIDHVLGGRSAVALLPTGGGKSICYQVPALLLDGLTIVVSPLIALMKDQVEQLQQRGVPCEGVYSGKSHREIDSILNQAMEGAYKLLYVSPERLKSDMFIARVGKMKVQLLAIDEAHCISQWGHDFRPAYVEIFDILEHTGKVPILAVTATANQQTLEEIQGFLKIERSAVFRKSFARQNLAYLLLEEENKQERLVKICQWRKGSVVVYANSRKRCVELSALLQRHGERADYYHAGLSSTERARKQALWMQGNTRIIVATNAFGMGIDKPDVRLVIHYAIPHSPEAYYQEAGRAGRDNLPAYAIAMYHSGDFARMRAQIPIQFPELPFIKRVYQALANYCTIAYGGGAGKSFDLQLGAFCAQYNFDVLTTHHAIEVLARSGYLFFREALFQTPKLHFKAPHEEVYKVQVENKSLDQLIKVLLRSYPGLYEYYVNIDLRSISYTLRAKESAIDKGLRLLHQMELVDYEAVSQQPQVGFIGGRFKDEDIRLDTEWLKMRQQRYEDRVQWMENFARSARCRSQDIVAYYGEDLEDACGVCDVCIEQKKQERLSAAREAVAHFFESHTKILAQDVLVHFDAFQERDVRAVMNEMVQADQLEFKDGYIQCK